jgi:hypothetical protein
LVSVSAKGAIHRSTILGPKTKSGGNGKFAIRVTNGAAQKFSPALGAWCNLRKYFNFYDAY